MKDLFDVIILSLVQGATEFLPVSSSGHLVLFEQIFKFQPEGLDEHLINVVLHFGTMMATILVFKEELMDILKAIFSKRILKIKSLKSIQEDNSLWLVLIILIGTIPTGLIGLFFRDQFKELEGSILAVSLALIITGLILFSIRFIKPPSKEDYKDITLWDSLIIGTVQGLAITPGISRSGITISAGLWRNIRRDKIGHYSFLLSLPAIFGATLLELGHVNLSQLKILPLLIGFIVSFITGYIALKWLLKFVNQGKLQYFSYYCWAIGLVSLVIYSLKSVNS
ncbi:MAG TPA: undecaprenyl-diphosphate phosphatase [Spirochaetes bacterium]|nr:undecaprenyl-diphosphate phosphatase [Spirochaetota bacterium]